MSCEHGCFNTNWKELHVIVKPMKCVGRIGNIKGKKITVVLQRMQEKLIAVSFRGKKPNQKTGVRILNWEVKMLRDGNF